MNSSPWHLDDHLAALRLGPLAGKLDLTEPGKGLFDVTLADKPCAEMRLLALSPAGDGGPPADAHLRGADLLATYDSSADFPVRLDVQWRAALPTEPDGLLAAVELTISARTELLDSRPGMAVQSTVRCGEVLHLLDIDSAKYEPVDIAAGSPTPLRAGAGTGCLVVRIPDTDLSYAEMVHPTDFQRAEVLADEPSTATIRQHLFSQPLEKGVILRARLAAVLLSRQSDTQLAAAYYRQFTAAALPLST